MFAGSITPANFQLMLEFAVNITAQLAIWETQTRVGLVEFSSDAKSVFFMNSYYNKVKHLRTGSA